MNLETSEPNKIEKLRNFVEKYAIDFLDGGLKENIVNGLKNGDMNLALEILNSMDKSWIERAKEIGKFFVFEDYEFEDENGNRINNPFYKANYIDSLEYNQEHIPTLRYVKSRYIQKEYIYNENER